MKTFLFILFYKFRNIPAHWRAFWCGSKVAVNSRYMKVLTWWNGGTKGCAVFQGKLFAVINRADGTKLNLGCVGKRVITTAFVNYLRDDLANAAGSADVSTFKYHDSGTGTVAENITDTTMGTATGDARVAGTQNNGTAKTYISVATLPYTATLAITEHGLFSASTSGTLMDRTKFAAINVVSGDSCTFTYTLSISDNG